MMPMRNIFIILLILCGYCRTTAQELGHVVEFADREFAAGRFETAVHEYQRALIFSGDSLHPYLHSRIGSCFQYLGNYERAADHFRSAALIFPDDSLKLENTFNRISCLILDRRFYGALGELSRIRTDYPDYFNRKRLFYSGICHWGNFRFEDAFSCFYEAIPPDKEASRRDLLALQADFGRPAGPHPRLASWLSMIPGAGQVYAGDLMSGLNSFLLCGFLGAAGYLSVISFKSNLILLYIIPWIQRYYIGGMHHARALAETHQTNRVLGFYDDIMQIMLQTGDQ